MKQKNGYEIGDLIRCWYMSGMGFSFGIGLVIGLEEKYAKVCLQNSGEVVLIAYRSMYLITKSDELK
jgi:hypothetical protein|tara:strand:- start:48 stop:248 length:201 start_codon:yes stop_codon:yes gene_type:complete